MSVAHGCLYHILPKVNDKRAWKVKESSNPPDSKYEGEIENGLPNGFGKYAKTDGSTYVGSYKKGLRHGHGIFKWSENAPDSAGKYIGEYKDNVRWNGTIYDKFGVIVYEYVNGKMQNSSSHNASLEIN